MSAVNTMVSFNAKFVPGLSTNQPENVSVLGLDDRFSQAPYGLGTKVG